MDSEAPVQPGDVLADKYRVDRVLGSGGMGVVVAATHLELGQRVALKFLRPQALGHPEAAARFVREARAAVKIESEHVARVIDVGRLPDSGAPYMVMEYLDGTDLGEAPKGAALAVDDAVDYVVQACEAMAVAHAQGIVHRDLKPANLFLARRPDGSPIVKVLDFGISKLVETESGEVNLTQTASVMGSPLYMSPEQMRSAKKADARSDLWSLGAILYELLTGEPPFNGESLGEVFAAVMTEPAVPVRARRAEVPEGLEAIVMKCLEKDPAKRFGSVAELAVALSDFAPARSRVLVERVSGIAFRSGMIVPRQSVTPAVAPPPEAAPPAAPQAAATSTAWEDPHSVPPKRGSPLVWIAAFAAVVVGVGGFFVARSAPEKPPDGDALTTEASPIEEKAPGAAAEPAVVPVPEPAAKESAGAAAADAGAAEAAAAAPVVRRAAPSLTPRVDHPPPRVRKQAPAESPAPAPPPAKVESPPAPPASPASPPKKNPLRIDFK